MRWLRAIARGIRGEDRITERVDFFNVLSVDAHRNKNR